MLSFHEVTLRDREQMQKIFKEDGWYGSEYSFGNNILWGLKYHIEVAYTRDCLVVRYDLHHGRPVDERLAAESYLYSYPAGNGDKRGIIEELITDSRKKGCTLLFNSVSEKGKEEIKNWFPDLFLLRENRDYEDYIYDREKLANLTGRKMHKKRTHVARFKEAGPWNYETLNDRNLEECEKLCTRWVFSREEKWNDDMAMELKVLKQGFKLRKELGLTGGVLRQNGVVIAFCMGEAINDDVFDVHFEKALPEYQGAYPLINQQFVLHECEGYTYINREEDTGDPGLRKAKLSYYPEILLKKYEARLSPVVRADKERHKEVIIEIWQQVFGDDRAFIEDFLESLTEGDALLLYMKEGKAVAMASFLSVELEQGEGSIPGKYVYAVATLPEYRKKGYARAVLETAADLWKEPLILSPAERSLYTYYEKLGYETWLKESSLTIERKKESEDGWQLRPVDVKEYTTLRNRLLSREGLVKWKEEQIAFAHRYYTGEQGQAAVRSGAEEALFMYDIKGDELLLWETSLSDEELERAAEPFLAATKTKRLSYSRPGLMIRYPEAMEEHFAFGEGYFSFSFGD